MKWLNQKHIYGDLSDQSVFVDAFCDWHQLVTQEGVVAALSDFQSRVEVRVNFG